MLAAVFGLLGVLVGGLITGAVDLWLERHRQADSTALAKRLVADELHTCWGQMS